MGCGSSAPRHAVAVPIEEPSEVSMEACAQDVEAPVEPGAQAVEAPVENAHVNDAPSAGKGAQETEAPAKNALVNDDMGAEGSTRQRSESPSELSGTATPLVESVPASPVLPTVVEGDLEITACKMKDADMNSLYEKMGRGKMRSITLARCEIGDVQVPPPPFRPTPRTLPERRYAAVWVQGVGFLMSSQLVNQRLASVLRCWLSSAYPRLRPAWHRVLALGTPRVHACRRP